MARISDRLTPSEAMNLVATMLDSFPARSAMDDPDPEGYEPALCAALLGHPREVAEDCADIRLGVVRECLSRRSLTAGRVHDWCTRHGTVLREFVERENERAIERARAAKAAREAAERTENLTPEERRAAVDKFWAKLGPGRGLKRMDAVDIARGHKPETEDAEREAQRKALDERTQAANERAMLGEYAARGLEPVRSRHGVLLAYDLVRQINPGLLVRAGQREAALAAEMEASFGARET
jgi:hypothetical protein